MTKHPHVWPAYTIPLLTERRRLLEARLSEHAQRRNELTQQQSRNAATASSMKAEIEEIDLLLELKPEDAPSNKFMSAPFLGDF